eukprot:SAG11_NODE_6381_length_1325_cov_1.082382_1_plen_77_part_00
MLAAQRGRELDSHNEDCVTLFEMAATKLGAEAEELLSAGDPDGAAALAASRLALAPVSFSQRTADMAAWLWRLRVL